MPVSAYVSDKDALSQVLGLLRLRADLIAVLKGGADWGVRFEPGERYFHMVAEGSVYLRVDGDATLYEGKAGDLFVLPHGDGHDLLARPGSAARPLEDLVRRYWDEATKTLVLGASDAGTTLLCGTFTVDERGPGAFLSPLPGVVHLGGATPDGKDSFWALVPLIVREAGQRGPGSGMICDRLFETVVVYAIRSWVERPGVGGRSWLRGLRDPALARVLAALHADPGRDWDVQQMADAAGLSRATLAARFLEVIGTPPMRYLTQQRMAFGATLLREGASVAGVAERVGYDSESSFSRTFKRIMGVPPGALKTKPAAPKGAAGS